MPFLRPIGPMCVDMFIPSSCIHYILGHMNSGTFWLHSKSASAVCPAIHQRLDYLHGADWWAPGCPALRSTGQATPTAPQRVTSFPPKTAQGPRCSLVWSYLSAYTLVFFFFQIRRSTSFFWGWVWRSLLTGGFLNGTLSQTGRVCVVRTQVCRCC